MKILLQHITFSKYPILLSGVLLLLTSALFAQQIEQSNETITTIKNFYKIPPLPMPANTLEVEFEADEPLLDLGKIEIDVKPKPKEDVSATDEPIIETFLKAYGRLGFGNYGRIYGEGFFEQQFNPRLYYGAHVRHLSAQSGPVGNNQYSAGSESLAEGFAYYGFDKFAITGEASYKREVSRFYGYDYNPSADFIAADSLKRRFNRFQAQIRHHNLTSETKQNKLFYNYGVDLRGLGSNTEGQELQAGLTVNTHYDISDKWRIQAQGQAWLTTYQDLGQTQERNYFQIQPMAIYRSEKIDIGIGANWVQDDDTLNNSENNYIFPSFFARYRMSRYFNFEVGYQGDVERNTWWDLTALNPRLSVNTNLVNTIQNWEMYAQLEGSFYPTWSYQAGASLASYQNMNLFFNTPGDSAKFTVLYDNVTAFTIEGETHLTIAEKLEAIAQAKIIAYDVKTFDRAYHLPNVEGNGILIYYPPLEGLRLEASLWLALGLEALNTTTGRTEKLSNIFDLSVEAEYQLWFWKEMSAFVSLNNILSVEYRRYLHYPNMGFNVLIGLAYGIR